MPARRAYGFIYARLVRGLPDDTRLKIDALLGDVDAAAALEQQRTEAIGLLGVEMA